jgi:hypothetical protein
LESEGSWLRSPEQIRAKFVEEARNLVSYAPALTVAFDIRREAGNVSLMPRDCHGKSADELEQLVIVRAQDEAVR